MADPIRIRRRTTGNAGAPATLLNAEPAYNEVDDVLYIGVGLGQDGNATTIKAIGGAGVFATRAYTDAAVAAVDVSAQLANYLTTATAASTYLTVSAASSTYLTQSNASSTYATQASLSSYLTTSAASSTYLTQAAAASTYATPASVTTAIQAVVGAAPAALDTLQELAASLSNDASFASTVTTSLSGKASTTLSNVDPATGRSALGLGSMATQAANNVAITGGTIDGVTIDGGSF